MHKFEHFFKTKPFFWILIPIFFLLKNSNIYFGFIPAGQLALLFVRYLLVALVIYVVVYWFTGKNAYKAAFYCTVFLSAYFFYSPLDEFIQAKTWLRPFNEYRYFLPFIFLCLLLILFSIHRMTRPPAKTILFINLLLSIFCLLETFRLSLKGLDPPKALLGIANKAAFSDAVPDRKAHPDIYFLLFDEYQGNAGLQKNFHYDNAGLIRALKSDSFYIPGLSRSNYNFTFFSMPSIFNMSYVEGDIQGRNNLEKTIKMVSGLKLMENASLFGFLKKNNYSVVNLSPFTIDGSGEKIAQYRSITSEKELIASQTIFYNLSNKFAWHFDNKAWLDLTNPNDYNNQYYNKYVEDRLIDGLAAPGRNGPRFTYAHFFLPHSPFLKDSSGNEVPFKSLMQDHPAGTERALYLGYLKYCNTVLTGLVGKIIKGDPGSIIIVMSDHGKRDGDPMQFNNQFSIRIPGADYTQWPDTVDAVNVFRILLNTQFGQKLDYLPYRSVRFDLSRGSAAQ